MIILMLLIIKLDISTSKKFVDAIDNFKKVLNYNENFDFTFGKLFIQKCISVTGKLR